jgi:hypothetical protein
MTGRPASRMALDVPPEATKVTPTSFKPLAKSIRPVLSDNERRAIFHIYLIVLNNYHY